MLFSEVLSTIHAESHFTVLTIVMIAYAGFLKYFVASSTHLEGYRWVERHRAENFLKLCIDNFNGLFTSLVRMSLQAALEAIGI